MPQWKRPNYKEKQSHNLWTRYRITVEEYERLVRGSKGLCEVCKTKKARVIDHCHVTGEIRGYVCHACNRGLGLLGDTEKSVEKAYEYIKRERTHGIPIRRRVSGGTRKKTLQEDDRRRSDPKVRRNVRNTNRTRNKRNR